MGPRYAPLVQNRGLGSPQGSAPQSLPSAQPSPAPIPSVVTGKAACDACFAAERAGRYLTGQGVGHYLAGCDDEQRRAACRAATKLSLPKRAGQLAADRKCDEALALLEFAQRATLGSPALTSAVASCRPGSK
jgi:hypothetical protein